MTKRKLLVKAKKCLAVLSTVALLLSCGVTGLFEPALTASAEDLSGVMRIFDEYGNDISENPLVYIENSSAAGQKTTSRIRVYLKDDQNEITKPFEYIVPPGATYYEVVKQEYTKYPGPGVHEIEMWLTLSGCDNVSAQIKDSFSGTTRDVMKESPYWAGQQSLEIISGDGTKYRKVMVSNQEPATDLNIKFNGTKMEVNDLNMENETKSTYVTITDKKYNFTATLVTAHSKAVSQYLDNVQWGVYERNKYGDLVPTNLAEISQSGVFTPKYHGDVVVVASLEPTEGFQYNMAMAQKAYEDGLIDSLPSYTIDPLTGQPTDRLTADGSKKIAYYVTEKVKDVDGNEYIKYDGDNHEIVYKTDDKGNRLVTSSNETEMPIRPFYDTIDNGVLFAEPVYHIESVMTKKASSDEEPDEYTDVAVIDDYTTIQNIPKYIDIKIILRNPAKRIDITDGPSIMDTSDGGAQLKYTLTPSLEGDGYDSGATDDLEWKSSDPSVVSVDENGVVTPHKIGTAQITAVGEGYNDDNQRITSNPFTITVISKAQEIKVEPEALNTRVGVSAKISAIEGPANKNPNDEVEWIVDNPDVIKIVPDAYNSGSNVQTATVIGLKEGTTYVKAVAKNSGVGIESSKCLVTVRPKNNAAQVQISADLGSGVAPVESGSDITLFTANTLTFSAKAISNNAQYADDTIDWSLSGNDDDTVTFENNTDGTVTVKGISEGTVTLLATASSTADSNDPIYSYVVINVLKKCDNVKIYDLDNTAVSSKNVPVGGMVDLRADLTINSNFPYNHSDSIVKWSSNLPAVASVSYNGEVDEFGNPICTVTAKSNGTATITATTASGKTASANVTVFTTSSVELTGVTLGSDNVLRTEINMNNYLVGTKKLGVTVKDHNEKSVSNSACIWTSSNEAVATVSSSGLVTAHDIGVTTITVSSGKKSQSCELTVYAPITAAVYESIAPYTYSPIVEAYEPDPVFTVGSHKLVKGTDYTVEYQNNTGVGKASMILTGKGFYINTNKIDYTIEKRSVADSDVLITYTDTQECTGFPITPALNISCYGVPLVEGTDYTVKYSNNVKRTTDDKKATITITGAGSYFGSVVKNFDIECHHTSLKDTIIYKEATYEEPGIMIGTCVACGEKNISHIIPQKEHSANPAQSVSFVNHYDGLSVGESKNAEINAVGKDSSKPATDEFRWISSNPKVVKVSENGVITGVSKGKAEITVYGEYDEVVDTCEVAVLTKIDNLLLKPDPFDTRVALSTQISATVLPENSEDELIWTLDDNSLATLEMSPTSKNTAIITGVTTGETILHVRGKYSNIEKTVPVTVNDRIETNIVDVSTKIDGKDTFIPANSTFRVFTNQDVTFRADLIDNNHNFADDTVVWSVSDNDNDTITLPTNAQQDQNFTIHAASVGTATLTAASNENPEVKTSFTIEVAKRCDKVQITDDEGANVSSKTLNVGDEYQLVAKLTTNDPSHPDDHGDGVRSWASDNTKVATVDDNGYVTAVNNGSANITVTTLSGQKSTAKVTVFTTSNVYLVGVTAPVNAGDDSTLTMTIDNFTEFTAKKTISATVRDQNEATVSGYTGNWSSSNETVATVKNGVITAHDVGVTTITVSAGKKSQSCVLTVYAPITAAEFEPIAPYTYSPIVKAYEPDPQFTVGSHKLVRNMDYTVEYQNNTGVGKASMTITGQGYYVNTKKIDYTIDKRSVSDGDVVYSYIDTQECIGSAITPAINISCYGVALVEGVDYTVKYSNNIKPTTDESKATVTVTGAGNYTGTKVKNFDIECHHTILKNTTVYKEATYEEPGILIGTCAACGEKNKTQVIPQKEHSENPAQSVSFVNHYDGLSIGESKTAEINAVATDPSKPATDEFRWSSSNPKIVKVSDDGVITGVAKGKAEITVYGEYSEVVDTCEVAVLTKIEDILFKPDPFDTRVALSTQISAMVLPENSEDELIWTLEDDTLATIEMSPTSKNTAIITGTNPGETVLHVRGKYSNIEKIVAVTINDRVETNIVDVSTKIDGKDTFIPANSTFRVFTNQDVTFRADLIDYNHNFADDTVVWSVSDNENATITLASDAQKEQEFTIHAASIGTATLTAASNENPDIKTNFTIEVAKRCDKIQILNNEGATVSSKTLNVGDEYQLSAKLTTNDPLNPDDHSDGVRGWASDNTKVAAVDANGYITAVNNGSANITVTTLSGQKSTAKITVFTTSNVYLVDVTAPVNEYDNPTLTITIDNPTTFTATKSISATVRDQNEANVSGYNCKWSSSNEAVATVENGVITAHDIGMATITVQAGTKQTSCDVTVMANASKVFHNDAIADMPYDPSVSEYCPEPEFSSSKRTFIKDIDYTLEYSKNTELGSATVTAVGIGYCTGTKAVSFKIVKRDLSDTSIVVKRIPAQEYDGTEKKPPVKISCNGVSLTENVDFTAAYSKNRGVGTAEVKVTCPSSSNYTGTLNLTFPIVEDLSQYTESDVDDTDSDIETDSDINTDTDSDSDSDSDTDTPSERKYGDIDGNGKISSSDALSVYRYSLRLESLTDEQIALADIDGDDLVTATDAVSILRFSAGRPHIGKVGQPS